MTIVGDSSKSTTLTKLGSDTITVKKACKSYVPLGAAPRVSGRLISLRQGLRMSATS